MVWYGNLGETSLSKLKRSDQVFDNRAFMTSFTCIDRGNGIVGKSGELFSQMLQLPNSTFVSILETDRKHSA